ncbi:ATP-binding protein [Cerasicoccus frondis]|uniref:ATP-binding protein n=1 Tax=Cerasicoccus frondis TaxID=490090 RepID=UPI002852D411|nr:ATP-binding protein [Cerasicoccus frondis]
MANFQTRFSVDNALLQELGERLVTTPHVALAELVKNSYDADATEVHVTVRTGEKGGPEIEVSDNGSGMTLEQLQQYWMRIGTTHKQNKTRSEIFGRPVTGSKGIGRFCVRRLGSAVELQSCSRKGKKFEHVSLKIDWNRFTPGEEIGQVEVEMSRSVESVGQTGLKLIMSGHRNVEWYTLEDRRSYNYLLRQLATLSANVETKRRGYERDPGFNVYLDAPALEHGHAIADVYAGLVDEDEGESAIDMRGKLMDAGWALLSAKIIKGGFAECKLVAKTPVGTQTHTSKEVFPNLTNVSLELAVFVDERNWNRDENLVTPGKLRKLLNDWGGVQLRINGMRVYPYGDREDDWLNIERDKARRLGAPQGDLIDFANALKARNRNINPKRVLLSLLANNSFLGSVDVGISQNGLEPKADREGFIENATFRDLRRFTRYAIDWAMIWRDYALRERSRIESEKRRKELEKASGGTPIEKAKQSEAAIRFVRKSITKFKKHPEDIRDEDFDALASATSLLESEIKTNKADILRFQLVASTSTLSLLYHHEVRYLMQALGSLSEELNYALSDFDDDLKTKCESILSSINISKENLKILSDLTNEMSVLHRGASALKLDLATQAEKAISRFGRVCKSYSIDISTQIGEGMLVGPMLKGELAAIILNSISNAIKAVVAGGVTKNIELCSYRSHGKVCLEIKDTGIGLDEHEYDDVFSPLVSDPSDSMYDALEEKIATEDRTLLGQGSGLGLSIIRGILENRNGRASFVKPEGGWSTCLKVEFPTPK